LENKITCPTCRTDIRLNTDNNGNEIIIDKNKNGQYKDKCTYPNMLDRIFASGSNLKTNNMNGMYAGDNLFAKF